MLALSSPLTAAWAGAPPMGLPLVNLAHLDHLYQEVRWGAERVGLVALYAEAPDYEVVGDDDEGFACVDDAARALQVYLRHHQATGSPSSLRKTLELARFILRMEAPRGRFYNFVDKHLDINRTGPTSRAEIGWWTGRAVRALGEAHALLSHEDSRLARRVRKSLVRAARAVSLHDREDSSTGLPRDSLVIGALYLDGFVRFLEGASSGPIATAARDLASSLLRAAHRYRLAAPRGALAPRAGALDWHGWGSHAGEGLMAGYRLTGEKAYLDEALRTATVFDVRRLLEGLPGHYRPGPDPSEQIAYGISTRVSLLLRLHRATGDALMARLAGLHAAWLFGNNRAGVDMYDISTGRCFDGVTGGKVNRNSGAESTVEALLTLLDLADVTEARRWVGARRIDRVEPGQGQGLFELPDGSRWVLRRGGPGLAPALMRVRG